MNRKIALVAVAVGVLLVAMILGGIMSGGAGGVVERRVTLVGPEEPAFHLIRSGARLSEIRAEMGGQFWRPDW